MGWDQAIKENGKKTEWRHKRTKQNKCAVRTWTDVVSSDVVKWSEWQTRATDRSECDDVDNTLQADIKAPARNCHTQRRRRAIAWELATHHLQSVCQSNVWWGLLYELFMSQTNALIYRKTLAVCFTIHCGSHKGANLFFSVTLSTRRPASADRTARAANYRRRITLIDGYLERPFPTACLL